VRAAAAAGGRRHVAKKKKAVRESWLVFVNFHTASRVGAFLMCMKQPVNELQGTDRRGAQVPTAPVAQT
jgi:hypothetical protein